MDAFTDRPFAGNPAAVVLLPADEPWPQDDWLQQVALEMNLSETAFARPEAEGADARAGADGADGAAAGVWRLRWFTPATEVDLCGHATLATAHVLHSTGAHRGPVRFRTRSGELAAETGEDGAITLDFPANPPRPVPVPPGLAGALGTEPVAAFDTGALGDLLVELADEDAVRALSPDLSALAGLGIRGVIVTARARAADGADGYDFVSRFFGPAVGVPEDPVTGSAHTALAPLWSARLGRDRLTGLQASARSGLVGTELAGHRVRLTGRAVTVLEAELLVR